MEQVSAPFRIPSVACKWGFAETGSIDNKFICGCCRVEDIFFYQNILFLEQRLQNETVLKLFQKCLKVKLEGRIESQLCLYAIESCITLELSIVTTVFHYKFDIMLD